MSVLRDFDPRGVAMKRRDLLRLGLTAGLLAGAAAFAVAAPLADGLREVGRRGMRAPADLLARIRRRTRPLDMDSVYQPHDLAG